MDVNDSCDECGPERAAAPAEFAGALGHLERRHRERLARHGDVHEEGELTDLLALVAERLGHEDHDVPHAPAQVEDVVADGHAQDREARVAAPVGRHVEASDLRVAQVLGGRPEPVRARWVAVEEPVAVHDLQDAVGAGAVREVHAVPERDRSVHAGGRGRGRIRARLLADEPEVADEAGIRGVREVVDLRHPVRAPALRAAVGDEVRDARRALPPVLVRLVEPADDRGHEPRTARIGDVPYLVREPAEGPQKVRLRAIALRQVTAVADPDHRGSAGFRLAGRAGDVVQVLRLRGIGHVDDRRAVQLHAPGERVHALAAVVADVGDPIDRLASRRAADTPSAPATARVRRAACPSLRRRYRAWSCRRWRTRRGA